jgi:uncharacterized membrane protein
MRKFLVLIAAALLPVAIGCDKGTETFQLSAPTLSTHVTQGETKTATISIKRGKNFDQDVTLKFGDLPKGVTITPTRTILKHGDSEVQTSVSAASDAAIGDFTIAITGSPGKGADSATSIKITVAKK